MAFRSLASFLICLPLLAASGSAPAQDDPWSKAWVQVRTASVRLHHEAGHPVAPADLRALESAVQRLADELRLTAVERASLRTDPIDYLYLRSPSSLNWFGAEDVDGLAIVAERRIVAARVPHEHELVHVLAHIAISPAPPHNHPWLQEGLASYLGGHLGESPTAVLGRGDDVLDRYPGLIGRLLTVTDFRESSIPAEECYAAAARFVHYLDEARGGRGRILEVLRLLAGSEEEVGARPASIIETQLEGVYATDFASLLEDFEQWRAERPVAGIRPGEPPRRPADLVLEDDDHRVRWWMDQEGWVIAAAGRNDFVDLALVWGNARPAGPEWTAPARPAGFELRLDDEGGHLVDNAAGIVRLRWFDRGRVGTDQPAAVWHLPALALVGIRAPSGPREVALWSRPRFLVD